MLRKSLPFILFLALCVPPLSAVEDNLVGTWEASGEDGGSFTARLVFQDDGTFGLSSVSRTEDGYWRPPQFQEDDDLSADEADALTRLYREAWPETPLDARSFLQWPGTSADALLLREADPLGKPLAYRRVDVASAVAPATWGDVKATLGR